MNIRVLLAGVDVTYITRLSDIMSRTTPEMGDLLEVTVFTSKDKMIAALEGRKGGLRTKYHLALLDGEMLASFPKSVRIPAILCFTGNASKERTSPDNPLVDSFVYKYQQVSKIVKKLMTTFLAKRDSTEDRQDTTVCAFFSSGGGMGTSTVAAAFAMSAVKAGLNPLYVDFEPFNSTEMFFRNENSTAQSLHDVFVYKKDGGMVAAIDLVKIKDSVNGVSFIKGFPLWSEVVEISPADVEAFIAASRIADEIDLVVLDIGRSPIGFTERVLDYADEIFIVSDTHQIAKLKLNRLMDKNAYFYQECLGKSHLIFNRIKSEEPKSEYEFKSTTYIPIAPGNTPADVASSVAGHVSSLINPGWKLTPPSTETI